MPLSCCCRAQAAEEAAARAAAEVAHWKDVAARAAAESTVAQVLHLPLVVFQITYGNIAYWHVHGRTLQ